MFIIFVHYISTLELCLSDFFISFFLSLSLSFSLLIYVCAKKKYVNKNRLELHKKKFLNVINVMNMNLFCIIYNVCSYFVSLFLLLSFVSPFFHYHLRFTIYKVHKASKKKREKSSAKKERKATKTLAIVLGEYNNDYFCYNHELIIFIFISSYCFFQMFFFIACT